MEVIFLRDKSGRFKLREDIQSFGLDKKSGQYYVKFNKGDNYLHYNPANVDVAKFTRQLEPPFRVVRKEDGEVFFKVLGVRVYEGKHNKAYRVVYESGHTKDYPSDYLSMEEHIDDVRSINVWEYLNEVAKYHVIKAEESKTEDGKTVSLADKYARRGFVAKGSLLEAYLNVNTYKNEKRPEASPIFPFGCNRSQYKAVCNALENNLSVIQGPPGTGKTQTILNIMANLLLAGKTMQIVSNNNSAVENVLEKLDSEGIGFICAQLGRTSNKKTFVESQTGSYPDMSSWKLENAASLMREVAHLSKEMQVLYEYQEDLSVYSEKVEEYKRQLELFPYKVEGRKRWSVSLLRRLFDRGSMEMERYHRLRWLTRFRLRFHRLSYGENALDELHYLLTSARLSSLEKQCESLKERLKGSEKKNERLRELSRLVFKNHLYQTYGKKSQRPVFSQDELFLKSRLFLVEYPVVLSTTFSATSNINPIYSYDYIIMDEASQVDIASGALALSSAKNAVVVGDLKQLPNVVTEQTEEIVSAIFAKYSISEAYRYSSNSFLSSLCKLFPSIPQTLLKEHYRCDPLIIGFCSKQFYNGELIPMKKTNPQYSPIRVVKTVKGNHARGAVNLRQVSSILEEVIPSLEEHFSDIGIIAPYNGQVNAMNTALVNAGKEYVTATVHKYQGREKDVIILSTVDNEIGEFTDDPHLLNVAVSRAKKQFTLVVSSEEQRDSNIQDLIDYIEYYGGKSEPSKISSIFDLLYEDYTKDLLEFYKTHRRVSEFDSENLAYWTIHDIIKEQGISNIRILMHYPLHLLITPVSDLNAEQSKYALHPWTHLDFLLYDTVTHKAKLAIEVDGTQYHKADSAQGHRDVLKNEVLEKIGLPLLRLSTAGSQEKQKIVHALLGNVSKNTQAK